MEFFATIRSAEPALITKILSYIEHPLAVNTLHSMVEQNLLQWHEYNTCWHTLWQQRVTRSPYRVDVDFGRAYTVAMCSTTLCDDALQPRDAGATLQHVTRKMVTWRQPYTSLGLSHNGCWHNDESVNDIMSSLKPDQYFSPTLCHSRVCTGETVANAVQSFRDDVRWDKTLSYITERVPEVLMSDGSKNVSCFYLSMLQYNIRVIRIIIAASYNLPNDYILCFCTCIPDQLSLFIDLLNKQTIVVRPCIVQRIFSQCYNTSNAPYLRVLLSNRSSVHHIDTATLKKITVTDAGQEMFLAGVPWIDHLRHEVACVWLGYRTGFLQYLKSVETQSTEHVRGVAMACVESGRYCEELFDCLRSNGITLIADERLMRVVLKRIPRWTHQIARCFGDIVTVQADSITSAEIPGHFCQHVHHTGADLALLSTVLRGCDEECLRNLRERSGRMMTELIERALGAHT